MAIDKKKHLIFLARTLPVLFLQHFEFGFKFPAMQKMVGKNAKRRTKLKSSN